MLEFKKRELELKVYGEEYKLSFPTVKETQDYAKKVNGASEDKAAELVIDFLAVLGLPGEVTEGMEPEHLRVVLEELMPSKKK